MPVGSDNESLGDDHDSGGEDNQINLTQYQIDVINYFKDIALKLNLELHQLLRANEISIKNFCWGKRQSSFKPRTK